MSLTSIWIHSVWSTKYRQALLTDQNKRLIIDHIKENLENKGIYYLAINGWYDHLHCLFQLPRNKSVAEILQMIKGESSYWINKQNLYTNKFRWQDDYYANSVSDSNKYKVKLYIDNQELRHKYLKLEEELKDLSKFSSNYCHSQNFRSQNFRSQNCRSQNCRSQNCRSLK